MEKEKEFKQAAREALEATCWCRKDENGNLYYEIYADYNDEMDKESLKKICDSDDPEMAFYDILNETYQEADWYETDEIIKKVLEDEDVAEFITEKNEDEAKEIIRDMFYVKYPEEHYLNQEIQVDIILDTGDANYDFTLNNFGPHYDSEEKIEEESSILWLARQQGYTKTQLKIAMRERPAEKNFMQSIYDEIANTTTHMNAVAFMVAMTLEEYFKLKKAIDAEKDLNKNSYLENRKGKGYIILGKDTVTGLYDQWNGAGGMLEITLEKDLKIPLKCIFRANPDCTRHYNVQEIYGVGTDMWENTLKEIHPMKKTA